MYVIKKDSTKSPFNFEKIVDMVYGAVRDFPNGSDLAEEILDDFTLLIRNNITTTEIQNQLLNTVRNKISIDKPEMDMIAGKLLMSNIISDAEKSRGFEFGELVKLYEYNLKPDANGIILYEDNIDLKEYYEILSYLESHINKSLNYTYRYASSATWKLRYLLRDETPVEVFALIAGRLALHTKGDIKHKRRVAKKYLDALCLQKISLATPFLSNLRKKNAQLASCFENMFLDDLGEQFEMFKDMANISKNGGGIGNYMGAIRGKKSRIKTKEGVADSVIPVNVLINYIMNYVNQEGVRKGASTVALDAWHIDIMEFFELVTETGEIRRKALDLFLQLVVEDRFIYNWENNLDHVLVCPLEVKEKLGIDLVNDVKAYDRNFDLIKESAESKLLKVSKIIRARDIFKGALSASVISGTPYHFNTVHVNEVNPLKDIGTIKCGNLCMESFSMFNEEYSHTCNLVSLVYPNIDIEGDDYKETCALAVDILDTIVDITKTPTEKANRHNNDFRVLGVGAMGIADTMAYYNKDYVRDVPFISELFERRALYLLEQSIMRAKEHGKFPRYADSEWAKGKLYSRDLSWYEQNSNGMFDEWVRLYELQMEYGVRNAQLMADAPNTSTSILQGVTASIFPTYSKFHMDSSSLGALPIMPRYIKEKFWYYKEYKHHSIIDMNTFVSEVQKWNDAGISYEWVINVDEVTIDDLERFYIDAYKKKVKTIYYIRWIRNKDDGEDEEINEKVECVSCAG